MKKRTMALSVLLMILAGLGITDAAEMIWQWAMIRTTGIYMVTFYDGVIQSVIGAVGAVILGMIWATWVENDLENEVAAIYEEGTKK